MKILRDSRTIAVVGCSRDHAKAAHTVPKYLQEHGYRIIPVNPIAEEILGERAYSCLSDIKVPIDIVDIFRPSSETYGIVAEAVKLKPKLIWLQLGILDESARKLSESNGIHYVEDRCIKLEHQRLLRVG